MSDNSNTPQEPARSKRAASTLLGVAGTLGVVTVGGAAIHSLVTDQPEAPRPRDPYTDPIPERKPPQLCEGDEEVAAWKVADMRKHDIAHKRERTDEEYEKHRHAILASDTALQNARDLYDHAMLRALREKISGRTQDEVNKMPPDEIHAWLHMPVQWDLLSPLQQKAIDYAVEQRAASWPPELLVADPRQPSSLSDAQQHENLEKARDERTAIRNEILADIDGMKELIDAYRNQPRFTDALHSPDKAAEPGRGR